MKRTGVNLSYKKKRSAGRRSTRRLKGGASPAFNYDRWISNGAPVNDDNFALQTGTAGPKLNSQANHAFKLNYPDRGTIGKGRLKGVVGTGAIYIGFFKGAKGLPWNGIPNLVRGVGRLANNAYPVAPN